PAVRLLDPGELAEMPERLAAHRLVHGRGDLSALDELHALGARVPRRRRVDHAAAADGRSGTQHHAVAARRDDGLREPQLCEAISDADDPGEHAGRAVVYLDAVGDLGQLFELDVEPVARWVRGRCDERIAAPQLASFDTRQSDGDSLTGFRALGRAAVHLHAPHAYRPPSGLGTQLVAFAERARPERSGGDGAD